MFENIPRSRRYWYVRVSSKSLEYQKQEFIQLGIPEKNYGRVKFKDKTKKSKFIEIKKLNNLIIGQSYTINFYELLFE